MDGTNNNTTNAVTIGAIVVIIILVIIIIVMRVHHHAPKVQPAANQAIATSQTSAANSTTPMDQATQNLQAGQAFLATNKTAAGVITTASGLQYKVIKMGTGAKPTASSTVQVDYTGKLIDGTVFDASANHGGPIEFPVNGVIAGWTEALQLMPVGSEFELYIPSNLAYGANGAGGAIGPNETLIFDVTLLKIVK